MTLYIMWVGGIALEHQLAHLIDGLSDNVLDMIVAKQIQRINYTPRGCYLSCISMFNIKRMFQHFGEFPYIS